MPAPQSRTRTVAQAALVEAERNQGSFLDLQPPELGGTIVNGGVELAQALARSGLLVNAMAWAMLQYGMTDLSTYVERPSLLGEAPTAACAVKDLLQRFGARPAQIFSGLIHDVAASPHSRIAGDSSERMTFVEPWRRPAGTSSVSWCAVRCS